MLTLVLALAVAATPLIDAIRTGDAGAVRALLKARADVNAPQGDGATALHWAVYQDDLALVELLLGAGANVNAANDLQITPIYLAAASGNARMVRALLAQGARADAASETGVTPLMEAARTGSVDAVRALLDHGADVNAAERDRRQTALMWAVSRRHPAVVELLVARGADVHARTRVRPLTVMLDQGPRRTVKTSRQDARQIEAGGSTALLFAAQAGDAASARHLLKAGARIDDTAADGRSALVLAAFSGHTDVARVLLDAGADPNRADAGYTALHAAVLRGDHALVKALLVHGADPNLPLTKGSPVRRFGSQWALPGTFAGGTPLFVAATYLEVEILRTLLQAGASHDVRAVGGLTPLLAAAGVAVQNEARPTDLARWNIVDSDTPQVPRDEAEALEAVRLLLDAGAAVTQTSDARDTALHGAAANGHVSLIQLLADRGAVITATNESGQTPLDLTRPRGRGLDPSEGGEPPPSPAAELLKRLAAAR